MLTFELKNFIKKIIVCWNDAAFASDQHANFIISIKDL